MDIVYENDGVRVSGLGPVSLRDTLDCGQCFRWYQLESGKWAGIACGKKCSVFETGDGLFFDGVDADEFESVWRSYFDLDRDYTALREAFSENRLLKAACEFAPGIRLLRQESWEAFITFIVSQNNNIKRIRGIVEKLCAAYGEAIEDGGFAFPRAEVLAAVPESELTSLGCGYRAEYISLAAKEVYSGTLDLESLKTVSLEAARKRLLEVKGVGPKVADCVLLFGLGRLDRCPADVWMKRVLAALGGDLPECVGEHGGIAQQFLFHYVRNVPDALKVENEPALSVI